MCFLFLLVSFLIQCQGDTQPPDNSIFEISERTDSTQYVPGTYEWEDPFWHYRLDAEGRPVYSPPDLIKLIGGQMSLCTVAWDDDLVWQNMGPFDSRTNYQMNQGRVESISVNPRDTLEILIGGHNGGAWLTEDGGRNWTNTTDDEGFSVVGFHEIARHPKAPHIIYAATGTALDKWNHGQRNYGLGIVRSEDGGRSWQMTGHSPPFGAWNSTTFDVAIDPRSTLDSTILYTVNASSIFRWTGSYRADGRWDELFVDQRYFSGPAIFGNVGFHDIEIDRYGNVYFCNFLGVFKLPIGSNNIFKLNGIRIPENRSDNLYCFSDSLQNPVKAIYDLEINSRGQIGLLTNYYYAKQQRNKCDVKNGPYYYAMSKDGGRTWTKSINLRTAGYAVPNLAINKYDANILYFEDSGRQVRRSTDGGKSHLRIPTRRNHVDVRCLEMIDSRVGDTTGHYDILYAGNDGGIARLIAGDYWEDLTGLGLANTNYYGLGITEEDSAYIFLGAQDGSANFYKDGIWYTTLPGGDNGDCLIDPRDKLHVFQSANGTLQDGRVDGNKWRGRVVKSLVGGVGLFPLLMNPVNPDEIFAGGSGLFIGGQGGKQWQKVEGNHPPKRLNKIAMSKANPDVVYYVLDGFFWDKKKPANEQRNVGGIYKATRGLSDNWIVEDVTSNLRSKCIGSDNCGLPQILSSVTTDPADANRIWVTMSGFEAGKKVFYSSNGGAHWENISGCLPNLPAVCVVYDAGSNDGLYLGTDYGVFYKDADMEEWIYYGEAGPKCMVTDMHINETSNELFVSTLGRGLWKVALRN